MEMVSKLYSNIPDVESANVLKSIDELAVILVSIESIKEDFLEVSDEQSILFLTETGPPEVKKSWNEFIKRHGHRCVREAEMHEKEWAVDPMRQEFVTNVIPAPTRVHSPSAFVSIAQSHVNMHYLSKII